MKLFKVPFEILKVTGKYFREHGEHDTDLSRGSDFSAYQLRESLKVSSSSNISKVCNFFPAFRNKFIEKSSYSGTWHFISHYFLYKIV